MTEGILPLWKEKGMTSHDAVFKVRKIVHIKKVGHSGTLDPDVDGVLPICIGNATKTVEYLMNSGKTYEGVMCLGYTTTTEDKSGEKVEQIPIPKEFPVQRIDEAMKLFEGEIEQTPPMYSAVKVNGKRLYEYAREGKVIDRPSRKVRIDSFKRTSEPVWDPEEETLSFRFEAECGKGTYIRTLAVDTGKALGYPAHMSDLTRTKSGTFNSKECITLTELKEAVEKDQLETVLYPIERALSNFPSIILSKEQWEQVKHGAVLSKTAFLDLKEEPVVFFFKEKAVAIYGTHPSKPTLIKPVKVFRTSIE